MFNVEKTGNVGNYQRENAQTEAEVASKLTVLFHSNLEKIAELLGKLIPENDQRKEIARFTTKNGVLTEKLDIEDRFSYLKIFSRLSPLTEKLLNLNYKETSLSGVNSGLVELNKIFLPEIEKQLNIVYSWLCIEDVESRTDNKNLSRLKRFVANIIKNKEYNFALFSSVIYLYKNLNTNSNKQFLVGAKKGLIDVWKDPLQELIEDHSVISIPTIEPFVSEEIAVSSILGLNPLWIVDPITSREIDGNTMKSEASSKIWLPKKVFDHDLAHRNNLQRSFKMLLEGAEHKFSTVSNFDINNLCFNAARSIEAKLFLEFLVNNNFSSQEVKLLSLVPQLLLREEYHLMNKFHRYSLGKDSLTSIFMKNSYHYERRLLQSTIDTRSIFEVRILDKKDLGSELSEIPTKEDMKIAWDDFGKFALSCGKDIEEEFTLNEIKIGVSNGLHI